MVYPCKGLNIIYCYFLVLAMENAARKTKTKMTAAERKRNQRAKAQANMTEEDKQAYKQKENQRRSWLRRVQIAKMSNEEWSNFHAKEVAQVTASRKGKKQNPQLQWKFQLRILTNQDKSFGKALTIDVEQNFPTLPGNALQ